MTERKKEQHVGVEIEWHVPDSVVTRYANQMLVQFGDEDCYLSFFEIPIPIVLGTEEEQAEAAKAIKKVRAECIIRLAVPIAKVPGMVEAMNTTLANYRARNPAAPKTEGAKS